MSITLLPPLPSDDLFSIRLFSQSMHLLNLSSTGVTVVSDLLDLHLARLNSVAEVRYSQLSVERYTDHMGYGSGLQVTAEGSFGLVLNAASLEYCVVPENIDRFCELLKKCESVLCCRYGRIDR